MSNALLKETRKKERRNKVKRKMSTQTKDNFRKIINLWLMAFKMPGFCCGQNIILFKWPLWDACSCSDKKDVHLTGKCCDFQPTINLSIIFTLAAGLPHPATVFRRSRDRPSRQVFLGFPVPKSKCWDGSQDSKLPLHASHVALPT